jgi:hypothetical protein
MVNVNLDGKRVVALYEPVVINGPNAVVKAAAKADTGSTRSNIEENVIEEIGRTPHNDTMTINVGERQEERDAEFVNVDFRTFEGERRLTEVNTRDRDGVTGDFLIGQDLLKELDLVVDVERARVDEKYRTQEQQGYEVLSG